MQTLSNPTELKINKMKTTIDFKKFTQDEKFRFLYDNIYSKVNESTTGKLIINTKYCRIAANVLGGDYDSLTKVQKEIFKSDLVCCHLDVIQGINNYLKHR